MMRGLAFIAALLLAGCASAGAQPLVATPVLRSQTTVTGQPLAIARTDRPEVTSVFQTFAPGGETGWHQHFVSSHVYVIEGELTQQLEDQPPRVFKAGDGYIESVETWHSARNTSAAPLRLLVVTLHEQGRGNVRLRVPEPTS